MTIIQLLLFTVLLFLAQLLYLKVAKYFQIVDQPNLRSSHSVATITGAGIIFIIAMISYPIFFSLNYNYFLAGLFIAGLISFLDDLKPISYKIRILCHFVAVGLLFYQLDVFNLPALILPLLFILSIGIINAVNFMDGINGMTGGYALITLGTLLYINEYVVKGFGDSSLIITAMIAVLVFNYFNFRTKARCFAGDIGSVSIAVILIFLIGDLILSSGNVSYILLLLLYGLDTVTTIFFRLLRKENIFEAHRSHYFQFLVHEKKIHHLYVSSGYAIIQLFFNVLLVLSLKDSILATVTFALVVTYVFVILRFWMEGRKRLLTYTVYEKVEA
jgi:UDP-N-acetylmuramyl pentapeptide phosphotransferase/UDP-N-acetylglucosamine-1-phosphate transferase